MLQKGSGWQLWEGVRIRLASGPGAHALFIVPAPLGMQGQLTARCRSAPWALHPVLAALPSRGVLTCVQLAGTDSDGGAQGEASLACRTPGTQWYVIGDDPTL